jgi:hypothetical protein
VTSDDPYRELSSLRDDMRSSRYAEPTMPLGSSRDADRYDDYDDDPYATTATTASPTRRPVIPPDAPEPPAPTERETPPPPRGPRAGHRAFVILRTALVAILIAAGLGGVSYVVVHHVQHTTHHSKSFANVERMVVAISGGGTVNVTGAQVSEVTVRSTDRSTLLDEPSRQLTEVDGELFVVAHCPDSTCQTSYDITVPANTQVQVVVDHAIGPAMVNVSDITAPVSISTDPGDVHLSGLSGAVQVAASGDVTGAGLSGPTIDVNALMARQVQLSMTTAPSQLRVTTALSGTVSLNLPPGSYQVEPANSAYQLQAPGLITISPRAKNVIQLNLGAQSTANIGSGS